MKNKKYTDERENINHNMSKDDLNILNKNSDYLFTRTDHVNIAIKEYIVKHKLTK